MTIRAVKSDIKICRCNVISNMDSRFDNANKINAKLKTTLKIGSLNGLCAVQIAVSTPTITKISRFQRVCTAAERSKYISIRSFSGINPSTSVFLTFSFKHFLLISPVCRFLNLIVESKYLERIPELTKALMRPADVFGAYRSGCGQRFAPEIAP